MFGQVTAAQYAHRLLTELGEILGDIHPKISKNPTVPYINYYLAASSK